MHRVVSRGGVTKQATTTTKKAAEGRAKVAACSEGERKRERMSGGMGRSLLRTSELAVAPRQVRLYQLTLCAHAHEGIGA